MINNTLALVIRFLDFWFELVKCLDRICKVPRGPLGFIRSLGTALQVEADLKSPCPLPSWPPGENRVLPLGSKPCQNPALLKFTSLSLCRHSVNWWRKEMLLCQFRPPNSLRASGMLVPGAELHQSWENVENQLQYSTSRESSSRKFTVLH